MVDLDIEDPAALRSYLVGQALIGPDEPVSIARLSGGVSNRVMRVTCGHDDPQGKAWVVKQALPKLRVSADWYSPPERIHREALGLAWLGRLLGEDRTPHCVFEDEARHVLVMTAVAEPFENWKTMLMVGRLEDGHLTQFAMLLADLHGGACASLAEVTADFGDRSFFESLRLEPYYLFTAERQPRSAAFYRQLVADTRARALTLVHGDYSPKNVLVTGDRLVLLDHEVLHVGDPAFDLGFSLAHLLSKARHVVAARDRFADAARQHWATYRKRLGEVPWAADLEPRSVRHALGCLLARVDGRSPLEYLRDDERADQRRVALRLMASPPGSVEALVDELLGDMAQGRRAP